ncbi:MAG TPA: DinB family protein [Bryobacteraceae bacterium]|nr:DinB family protein [Bryobacteraceae bacterium]
MFAFALMGMSALQAQSPLLGELKQSYTGVKNNLLRLADAMPEAGYSFKPTPEIQSFAERIAHVADTQFALCGMAKGEQKRGDAASKTSKADLVAALKESFDYCDGAYDGLSDSALTETVKMFGRDRTKFGVLDFNVVHDTEMYGYLSVYLRLKGVVPPSSAGRGMGKKQ